MEKPTDGKFMEYLDSSNIALEGDKWYGYFGKYFFRFLKPQTPLY